MYPRIPLGTGRGSTDHALGTSGLPCSFLVYNATIYLKQLAFLWTRWQQRQKSALKRPSQNTKQQTDISADGDFSQGRCLGTSCMVSDVAHSVLCDMSVIITPTFSTYNVHVIMQTILLHVSAGDRHSQYLKSNKASYVHRKKICRSSPPPHSCTVHLDTIKVLYLPTDAQ